MNEPQPDEPAEAPDAEAPRKPGVLGRVTGGARAAGRSVMGGAAAVVGGASAAGGKVIGGAAAIVGGASAAGGKVVGGLAGAGSAALATGGGLVHLTGKAVKTTAGGALSVGGQVLDGATATVISSARFIASAEYRRTQGWPWLRLVVARNRMAVWQELSQSDEMLRLMWRYARMRGLSDEEKAKVRAQLLDLAKVVPALGIFMLPGGAVLLPLLARALPWDLLPSSFMEQEAITPEDIAAMARPPATDPPADA